ncbi:MAG: hypothetical protein KDE27_02295 [Planctomycetes bacterium]|nr:hypothetical protein [Planctomycetota bacterium]
MRAATLLSGALLVAACAGDPYRTAFDASAGEATVVVLGDGFVRVGADRMPLEEFVLALRQRTRGMTRDERARFVVRVLSAREHDPAKRAREARDLDRLLGELQIMGVTQVQYL